MIGPLRDREKESVMMNKRKASFVPWLSMVLAGLLVCLAAPAAAADIADPDITYAIENQLRKDAFVNANAVDIHTQSGVTTLTGTVSNLLARERVERIAEHVVGVRAVINLIQVEPSEAKSDMELKKAVEGALLRDPATDSYEVTVTAAGGAVTLTGSVDSWQEKDLCTQVAKQVPGVMEIQNNLLVVYNENRPDLEVKTDIEGRLANDILVDDNLVEVSVEDGNVTLSGTVGSLAEKSRARRDAWVLGTKSVNADALEIKPWARDELRRKDLYAGRSDDDLARAVEDALVYDPRVSGFQVDVHAKNGTVTLSGVVDNLPAMRAAQEDALNVIGVWRVKNYLKVRPDEIPTSEKLEARIASAIEADPIVDRADVTIDAYAGTVFLRGTVNTSYEKDRAEELASGAMGVVQVVNNLDYEHVWAWKPDWEIREEVKDELFWSPFVNHTDVEVQVDHGVVTLTGHVGTWSEMEAAEHNAYEGGAKDVRNELTVTFPAYGPHLYM